MRTEYRKEHVAQVNCVNKDRILVYGVLLVLPSAFLPTQSNPRIALKSAQEQEDRRRRRNTRDRARRAAETAEQKGVKVEKWVGEG